MTTLQATSWIPVLDPAQQGKVIAWPQFWVSYTMTTLQATTWIPVLDPAQQCKVIAWPQFWVSYTMTTLQATSWIPVWDPTQQCKVLAWPQFWVSCTMTTLWAAVGIPVLDPALQDRVMAWPQFRSANSPLREGHFLNVVYRGSHHNVTPGWASYTWGWACRHLVSVQHQNMARFGTSFRPIDTARL